MLHLKQLLQLTPGQPVFITILSGSLDNLLALLALLKQLFQRAPIEGVREREAHSAQHCRYKIVNFCVRSLKAALDTRTIGIEHPVFLVRTTTLIGIPSGAHISPEPFLAQAHITGNTVARQ